MKILVTGATGFIGAHSMVALLNAGFEVRALVRSESKLKMICEAHDIAIKDVVVGDVTDQASVNEALKGCDGVVHTAAMVSTFKKDAELVMDTNVNGTKYVIGGAVEAGLKHIVHLSSITALYRPDSRYLSTNEIGSGNLETPYGKSKVLAERYVRELQDAGKPVNITYPGAVIGPLDFTLTEPHDGLVMFLRTAAVITSSGIQYVDVRDVAEASAKIIKDKLVGQRITMGGEYYTWHSLAKTLEKITGRFLLKAFIPAKLLAWAGKAGDIIARAGGNPLLNSEVVQYATNWVCTDDNFYHDELGLNYRDPTKTLEDAVYSLWDKDFLTRKEVGLLAGRRTGI